MTSQTPKRRDFIRVPFNTEAEVTARDRTIRSRDEIDISLSGLRLSADTGDDSAFEADTPCSARIVLAAGDNQVVIEATGKIRRSEPGSLAVEFTGLDLDSYQHLRQLILNNTDEPEKAEQEFAAHWGIRRPHS